MIAYEWGITVKTVSLNMVLSMLQREDHWK